MELDLDTLQLVTAQMSNATLEALSRTPIWNDIVPFANNQEWWYKRTEWLVLRHLKWRSGDWRDVYISLEKNGLEFNSKQNYRSTLLVSVLLEIGANPSSDDYEALNGVCSANNTEAARLLLADERVSVVDIGNRCLDRAVSNENRELVRLLMEAGADAVGDDNEVLLEAVERGDHVIVDWLLTDPRRDVNLASDERDEHNQKAIEIAAETGYTKIVELLIEAGADFSVYALAKAARNEHLSIVRLLLGLDVIGPGSPALVGMFHRACKFGSRELVEILLSTGIDPSVNDNYALQMASRYERAEIVDLLLSDPRVDLTSNLKRLIEDMFDNSEDIGRVEVPTAIQEKVNVLVRYKKMRVEKLDVPTSRLLLWILHRDELGSLLEEDTLYSTVLKFVILKRPNANELIDWMIELDDEQLAIAARSVLESERMDVPELIPFQALILSIVHPTLSLEELIDDLRDDGASDSAIAKTEQLIRAYLA